MTFVTFLLWLYVLVLISPVRVEFSIARVRLR